MIASKALLRLPQSESDKLPSRGQVIVEGTIQDHDIAQVVEPDGRGGHWLEINKEMLKAIRKMVGETVSVDIELSKVWHEPEYPRDFEVALNNAPKEIQDLWIDITPMARWEWIRWINATNVTETRKRRIEVSISKMHSGKRRPCCFNLASCTDPDVARSGKLIEINEA
jgi:hypothetical protein